MNWVLYKNHEPITSIPLGNYGFIYIVIYENSEYYIGKKAFYTYKTLPALKSGEQRPNSKRIGRNVNGKREYFDITSKESNWKTYNGSSKNTLNKQILSKQILELCPTKRSLTYQEARYQFLYDVLNDPLAINDNILGKFFKNKLE